MSSTIRNNLKLLKNFIVKFLFPSIAILVIWNILYKITDMDYGVPSIIETFKSLVRIVSENTFAETVLIAFIRVLVGLLIGTFLGVLLAVICHWFSVINAILSPIISIMKTTPIACIIVLLWIIFTPNQVTVFVVFLMVMPIVWQNSIDAFLSIDKDLVEVSEVFEFSKTKKIKLLILPSLLHYIIPAIITSIGLAWKAEIAAEIITSSNIGKLIHKYKAIEFDMAPVFAWTIIIVVISLIFEKTAKYFLRRLANESFD